MAKRGRMCAEDSDANGRHESNETQLVRMQELLAGHCLRSDAPYASIWLDLFDRAERSTALEAPAGRRSTDATSAAAAWIAAGFCDPEVIHDAQLLGCDVAAAVHLLSSAGLKMQFRSEPPAHALPLQCAESDDRERLRALLERDDAGEEPLPRPRLGDQLSKP